MTDASLLGSCRPLEGVGWGLGSTRPSEHLSISVPASETVTAAPSCCVVTWPPAVPLLPSRLVTGSARDPAYPTFRPQGGIAPIS